MIKISKIKITILLTFILTILVVGLFFYTNQILFFLYGYEQHLINNHSVESIQAYQHIFPAKKLFFLITTIVSAATTVNSFRIMKEDKNSTIKEMIWVINSLVFVILCIFFILAFTVGQIRPI